MGSDWEKTDEWVICDICCSLSRCSHLWNWFVLRTWRIMFDVTGQPPLPSNSHHRSDGDCLEGKRENCQVCSVQYCVQQLCTLPCTLIWTDLTVLWIGFCLTGPISLCLDSFLYCVLLCVVCMRRFVTGEVDLVGLTQEKLVLRTTTSFSALTLLVGSFDP